MLLACLVATLHIRGLRYVSWLPGLGGHTVWVERVGCLIAGHSLLENSTAQVSHCWPGCVELPLMSYD